MDGLVFACIAPHGYDIIAEIAGAMHDSFSATRMAMVELGEQMKAVNPHTIVVLTPHGTRIQGYTSICGNEFASGRLVQNGHTVEMSLSCNKDFANNLLKKAEANGLHVIRYVYGTESGSFSVLPLDWGSFIPLWFMGARNEYKPHIVVVTPTRDQSLSELIALGQLIAEQAHESGERVALIASADQGHAHDPVGPYGYHASSFAYDAIVKEAVESGDLEKVLRLPDDFVDQAKPDSLWQIAVLYGALQKVPLQGKLLSYEVPTYFGMLCASYSKGVNASQPTILR